MANLTFEQRHDLGKTPSFCPSKIYSALKMAILTFEQIYDLGEAPLICLSKSFFALYVDPF